MDFMKGRSRRGRGGFRFGSLLLFGLLAVVVLTVLNSKDIERYLKLRNM